MTKKIDSCTLVLFGATGNLARVKLYPGLFRLDMLGRFPAEMKILGVGRKPIDVDTWRNSIKEMLDTKFKDGYDQAAFERLGEEEISVIRGLTSMREWIWIAGNHDPAPPETLGGRVSHEFAIGKLTFRHIARRAATPGEISGHYHPKARIPVRGRRLSAPCFVTDRDKIILPAFGTYTGGLDTTDIAITGLFENGYTVHMLGNRKVHSFPQSALTRSRKKLVDRA